VPFVVGCLSVRKHNVEVVVHLADTGRFNRLSKADMNPEVTLVPEAADFMIFRRACDSMRLPKPEFRDSAQPWNQIHDFLDVATKGTIAPVDVLDQTVANIESQSTPGYPTVLHAERQRADDPPVNVDRSIGTARRAGNLTTRQYIVCRL
jgi:hypothetical protein